MVVAQPLDQRVPIEAPPSEGTAAQSSCCYAIEPGGNRVEVTTVGYLALDLDAPATVWDETDCAGGPAWGAKLPEGFNACGTPPHAGEGAPLDASLQSEGRRRGPVTGGR